MDVEVIVALVIGVFLLILAGLWIMLLVGEIKFKRDMLRLQVGMLVGSMNMCALKLVLEAAEFTKDKLSFADWKILYDNMKLIAVQETRLPKYWKKKYPDEDLHGVIYEEESV